MPMLMPALRRTLCACCLALFLAHAPAFAREAGPGNGPAGVSASAVSAPGVLPVDTLLAPVAPGEAGWNLGEVRSGGSRCQVSVDEAVRAPSGGPSFRVDYEYSGNGADPSACFAGIQSRVRRNLHKARGIEFAVRGDPPVAGLLGLVTSNPDDPRELDGFFGSFDMGGQWKTLRIPFRHMARASGPAPVQALAGRPGARPGDGVLRPDSVEELRIGLDTARAGRAKAPLGRGRFWVGDVGFFRQP